VEHLAPLARRVNSANTMLAPEGVDLHSTAGGGRDGSLW
jgi:hypothetical protein